jgi:hypothetical protein
MSKKKGGVGYNYMKRKDGWSTMCMKNGKNWNTMLMNNRDGQLSTNFIESETVDHKAYEKVKDCS